MQLRLANAGDAAAIAAIHAASWRQGQSDILPAELVDAWVGRLPHAWSKSILKPRGTLTVAVTDKGIAGFTSTEFARVWSFFVHPDFWGKGVARTMFEDVAARCGPGLYLHALRDNLRARRFYERCGLRAIAELNDLYFDYVIPSLIYAR